jgi:RNA polymerase sigma-B factor
MLMLKSKTDRENDGMELFRRWQLERDWNAREELVRRHLSLARKIARRYAHTREPFDDLFQVASLGLLKAIDRFDPDRGLVFSSFAVPTILGELKRHFRDRGWAIHVPRGLQELALKVQDADIKLSSRAQRSPTVADIAQYLEIDTEQVLEALEVLATHHAASLDAPVGQIVDDETLTRLDTIGVEDDRFTLVDTAASLSAAVQRLPDADRHVLALRFDEELTQHQIAERIGVSQMQVSRILRRITDQLRETMDMGHAVTPKRSGGGGGDGRSRRQVGAHR